MQNGTYIRCCMKLLCRPKQARFVQEYRIDRNGAQAAVRAADAVAGAKATASGC